MIKVFKILHGFYDNINNISLLPHVDVATRDNKYKLYQRSVKYDLRKHLFTNLGESSWNSLPGGVRRRLDTFWTNQDVLYNWEADFTGTRNQSLCSSQHFVYI